jgi:hypothetical protein
MEYGTETATLIDLHDTHGFVASGNKNNPEMKKMPPPIV